MQEAPIPTLQTDIIDRMVGRLAIRFLLDICTGQLAAPLDGLLLAAIIEANVNRLARDPHLQATYARLDSPPPDELRRPVSINALAISLGQPFETVRRHVNKLVEAGICAAGPTGVYVPTQVLRSPPFAAIARARYERLWRFYDELRELDAVEALRFTPPDGDDPTAPVLAAGRIMSDFFFRTTEGLRDRVRDPISGLLLLAVIRANSEHLPHAEVAAILRRGAMTAEHRTPVRVADLSRRLSVPYETTRRHAGWLVREGYCDRVGGGLLVSAEMLASGPLLSFKSDNLVNVRRMFRQVAALAGT